MYFFFLSNIFAGLVSRTGLRRCWTSPRVRVCEVVRVCQGVRGGGARPFHVNSSELLEQITRLVSYSICWLLEEIKNQYCSV